MNDRRTGEAPLRALHLEVTRIHRTEILLPHKIAFRVETKQSFGTKNRGDVLAVRGGSGIAMAGFRMALHAGPCFVTELVPNDLAIVFVEREQPPLMSGLIVG